MFQNGDSITFPDPNDPGAIVRGVFCELANDEPNGGASALVRYADGARKG